MELLTNSRLAMNRLCQRKHRLTYIDGWRPAKDSDALRFGTLMHKGLEAFWKGEDVDAALTGESDPFELAKAEELLRGYMGVYTREIYDVLAVEPRFEAPLLNPETWAPSRTYTLAGKIDVIVREKATGRVCVIEHKTTTTIDEDYWAKLQMDGQISTYVLGAEALGHQITDTIYDVIRKPGLRPLKATPIETRKYKADGTLYANQRDKDETPDEYRARVRLEIECNLGSYYEQRVVPRIESQLKDFLFDAWQSGKQIREAQLANRAPRNPDACFQWGARCSFWSVCTAGMDPAEHPELFRKTDIMHEELGGK